MFSLRSLEEDAVVPAELAPEAPIRQWHVQLLPGTAAVARGLVPREAKLGGLAKRRRPRPHPHTRSVSI